MQSSQLMCHTSLVFYAWLWRMAWWDVIKTYLSQPFPVVNWNQWIVDPASVLCVLETLWTNRPGSGVNTAHTRTKWMLNLKWREKILSVYRSAPCPRVLSSEHGEWELPGPICYLSYTFVSQTPRNTKNSEAGWVIKLRWNQTYPWIVSSNICSLRQGRGLLLKLTDSPRSMSSYLPDSAVQWKHTESGWTLCQVPHIFHLLMECARVCQFA